MNLKTALLVTALIGFATISSTSEVAMAEFSSLLAPTEFTSGNYILPQYDAFDHDYYRPPRLTDEAVDIPAVADFNIFPQQQGFSSQDTGTTQTEFIFDASASTDGGYDGSRLEVRWDMGNDDVLDSYFSRNKIFRHTFKEAGTYDIKLEVLDIGGNISTIVKSVTIVESTPPQPYFLYGPKTGTQDTIFHFDTSFSRDDQFQEQYLEYRFDWNGDGQWDTSFENKTGWNHRFGTAGKQQVIMQVRDPSGQTAMAKQNIITTANTPPTAAFTIKTSANGHGQTFLFDATLSSDQETAHNRLQYRWDFNYHGTNDIVSDTAWNYSDRHSGIYYFPGRKIIRLEVRDESGATAYAYATIEVTADETALEQYQQYRFPGAMGA